MSDTVNDTAFDVYFAALMTELLRWGFDPLTAGDAAVQILIELSQRLGCDAVRVVPLTELLPVVERFMMSATRWPSRQAGSVVQ